MADWTRQKAGDPTASPPGMDDLRDLLKTPTGREVEIVPLITTIAFVDRSADLTELIGLAIERARLRLLEHPPGDPSGQSIAASLWSLHDVLSDTEHFGSSPARTQDQSLLELLLPWEKRGSAHSQWANFAYAENLYMQERWDEAYAAFQEVLEERKVAFEPSIGINRNLDWELALCLYYAGHYREAAAHFRAMTANKGVPEGALSWQMAAAAHAKAGQVSEAEAMLDDWIRQRSPSVAEVAPILRLIDHAKDPKGVAVDYRAPSPAAQDEQIRELAAQLDQQLGANPRSAVASIYKDRSLDNLLSAKGYSQCAALALRCINAQPDRMDRAEYFLHVRVQALLGAGDLPAALAAARSYYNACPLEHTPEAIEVMAQVLEKVHANDSSYARRFKLQQLRDPGDSASFGLASLGDSIAAAIEVDAGIYNGAGLEAEHNREARSLGEANLLLMQNEAAEARTIFERLTNSANQGYAAQAHAGIARAIKAAEGNVAHANEYLVTHQP
jgi:hypothetical protein